MTLQEPGGSAAPPPPSTAPASTAPASTAPAAEAPAAEASGAARIDWPSVLSQLEGDVLAAEEALARGRADEIAAWGSRFDAWVPPSSMGPIPYDLRERAARLLQQQLAVAEALVERILQSQRQRDVAARMSYGPSRPVASYIDRSL